MTQALKAAELQQISRPVGSQNVPQIAPQSFAFWKHLSEGGMVPEALLSRSKADAETFQTQAKGWLMSASPSDILAELEYLERHKPIENKADLDASVDGHLRDQFWTDYLRDLSEQPLWAIKRACVWWRQLPGERFFPPSSELRARCLTETQDLRGQLRVARKILDYVPPGPSSTNEDIPDEEWAVLRGKMADFCAGPDVDRKPCSLMVKSQDHRHPNDRGEGLKYTLEKRMFDMTKGVPL